MFALIHTREPFGRLSEFFESVIMFIPPDAINHNLIFRPVLSWLFYCIIPLFFMEPYYYQGWCKDTDCYDGCWYVNITGQNSSGKLLVSSYSVNLTNGSYAYEISYPSYNSRDYSGILTVNGSAVPLVIPFTLKSTASPGRNPVRGIRTFLWILNLSWSM